MLVSHPAPLPSVPTPEWEWMGLKGACDAQKVPVPPAWSRSLCP